LHVGKVVILDDLLEDLVEPVERIDPMLHIGPRPRPSILDYRIEERREFILRHSLNAVDEVGDPGIGRTASLRSAF
jgi:hypothetical protein